MSIINILFFGVLILCFKFLFFRYFNKKRSDFLNARLDKAHELLRFFGPDDKMTGAELQQKLEVVTAGRRKTSVDVYRQLDHLVEKGLLSSAKVKRIPGRDLEVIEYFLPKK